MTWCRPLDIVRLLTKAADIGKTSHKFLLKTFEDSFSEYSDGCWADMSEELQASYTQHEIEGIQRIFTKFRRRFSIEALSREIGKKRTNERVHRLMTKKQNAEALIEDLYRVGMVGNSLVRDKQGNIVSSERWAFRGHELPDFDTQFEVHPALWAKFELMAHNECIPVPGA